MTKPQAAYFLHEAYFDDIYGPAERADVESQVEVVATLSAESFRASARVWPEVEIVLSSWGMIPADDAFLARFPRLRAIFYGAGSIRGFATEAMWRKGIRVTSASAANAVPVCEFAISQVVYALKLGWRQVLAVRALKAYPPPHSPPGAYRSVVALLSLGMIGRMMAERLRAFDFRVIAYDPFVSPEAAQELGVEMVSLDEAFATADVVSCHTPHLPETEKMIEGRHFSAMKPDATFLNTGRGAVVDEAGMIGALRERPDLTAVLDVTSPEPPVPGSPLYELPNVILTPHIAGSQGPECRRMGQAMADELRLFLAGKPMRHEIDEKRSALLA